MAVAVDFVAPVGLSMTETKPNSNVKFTNLVTFQFCGNQER